MLLVSDPKVRPSGESLWLERGVQIPTRCHCVPGTGTGGKGSAGHRQNQSLSTRQMQAEGAGTEQRGRGRVEQREGLAGRERRAPWREGRQTPVVGRSEPGAQGARGPGGEAGAG